MSQNTKPLRVLELFCGHGGVTRGLLRTGADVFGVDNLRRPSAFPHNAAYYQCDVFYFLKNRIGMYAPFDFIWASPPCQHDTALRHAPNAKEHKQLIHKTRTALKRTGLPYCIENVEGARANLRNPLLLCGSMFGLGASVGGTFYQLQRHRLFECSFPIAPPCACAHTDPVVGVYGGHARCRSAKHGGRGTREPLFTSQRDVAAAAMDIDGMSLAGMSQAIPPAYAEYILREWQKQNSA